MVDEKNPVTQQSTTAPSSDDDKELSDFGKFQKSFIEGRSVVSVTPTKAGRRGRTRTFISGAEKATEISSQEAGRLQLEAQRKARAEKIAVEAQVAEQRRAAQVALASTVERARETERLIEPIKTPVFIPDVSDDNLSFQTTRTDLGDEIKFSVGEPFEGGVGPSIIEADPRSKFDIVTGRIGEKVVSKEPLTKEELLLLAPVAAVATAKLAGGFVKGFVTEPIKITRALTVNIDETLESLTGIVTGKTTGADILSSAEQQFRASPGEFAGGLAFDIAGPALISKAARKPIKIEPVKSTIVTRAELDTGRVVQVAETPILAKKGKKTFEGAGVTVTETRPSGEGLAIAKQETRVTLVDAEGRIKGLSERRVDSDVLTQGPQSKTFGSTIETILARGKRKSFIGEEQSLATRFDDLVISTTKRRTGRTRDIIEDVFDIREAVKKRKKPSKISEETIVSESRDIISLQETFQRPLQSAELETPLGKILVERVEPVPTIRTISEAKSISGKDLSSEILSSERVRVEVGEAGKFDVTLLDRPPTPEGITILSPGRERIAVKKPSKPLFPVEEVTVPKVTKPREIAPVIVKEIPVSKVVTTRDFGDITGQSKRIIQTIDPDIEFRGPLISGSIPTFETPLREPVITLISERIVGPSISDISTIKIPPKIAPPPIVIPTKTLLPTVRITASRRKGRGKGRSKIEPITAQENILGSALSKTQDTILKQRVAQQTRTKQVQQTRQTTALKQARVQRLKGLSRIISDVPFTPLPVIRIPRPEKKKDFFDVIIGGPKKKVFRTERVSSLFEAIRKGRRGLTETAAASLEIRRGGKSLSESEKVLVDEFLGSEFRRGKKRGKFVQKREFRIGTPGEKREITELGIRARRGLSSLSIKKDGNERLRGLVSKGFRLRDLRKVL